MSDADWIGKDFYKVLGVSKDATADQIKKAYRKLARANHPDSNPDDSAKHERFKEVAAAYDVVGDAEKRKRYDEIRSMPHGYGAGGAGFDLSDLFGQRSSGGLGDVFGDIFRGGRQQQRSVRPQRGQDVETTATIGFDEALDGVTVSLALSSDAPCSTCAGTGGKPGTRPRVCAECDGAGFVVASMGGAFNLNETCPSCGGRQLVYDEPCPTCLGSGRGRSDRKVQARIPAGVKDGQRIRLRGKGGSGEHGGPPGDLYVTVKVAAHRLYGRSGDNLTLQVPISFDEAVLGGEVRIPVRGGAAVTLKIPPGTPTGRTFRVRGKGATRRDGSRGDLLVTVEVHVPATVDKEARQAVEAYRAATVDAPLRSAMFEEA
ncbi:molecular chaperone DnaJ [Nocardioides limicola]|uniref:molecular chaperone DnaJ n=1 Tax=Nocardioides limicola TaxID=2803368 RepID=UPI00193B393F|nr:molecular chaperone DnaJ [Nocardioides sp. DJM-14]